MSVLIKGMGIPKTCDDCYIRERNTCPLLKTNVGGWGRCIGCPLVEVPPHGDLIDRDALGVISWREDEVDDRFDAGVLFVLDRVDGLPTIIDAEEDE